MKEIDIIYAKSFLGLEALILAQKSREELDEMLYEFASLVTSIKKEQTPSTDAKQRIRDFIESRKVYDYIDLQNILSQLQEAEEVIEKEAQKIKSEGKFKKQKVLREQIFKLIRLSESMTLAQIANHFSEVYKEELEKGGLAKFSPSEINIALSKYCKK